MNQFNPQLADFDGNGRFDLISGSSCCKNPNCFYLYRRGDDGSFGERETLALEFSEDEFAVGRELPISGLMSRLAVGDWNGDGVPDVVIGNFWNHRREDAVALGVVYGPLDRDEALPVKRFWPREAETFEGQIRQPVLADWDGDGRLDLVFVGHVGNKTDAARRVGHGVYWMRSIGTATEPALAAPQLLVADKGDWSTTGVCIADWNGDGRLDLIAARTKKKFERSPSLQKSVWVTLDNRVWVYLRQDE